MGPGRTTPRPPPVADRDELLAAAADAANRCGLLVRALTLVDEALASPAVAADPVRAGLLHERRGWYLHRTGRPTDALAAHELAVSLVPERPPSAARARVVQAHAHALVRVGRAEAARPLAEGAVAVARSVDDRVDEGQALHVLGLVLASEGRVDDAVVRLHEAGQIAAELGDLAEVAGAYVHLWRTLVEAGRGDDLVELVLGLDPAATARGPGRRRAVAHRQHRRRRRSTSSAAGTRPNTCSATMPPPARSAGLTAVTRTLVSGSLAVDRGDHDRARDELEIARTWCHQVGDGRLNGLLHRSLAELAAWQGRTDDARREVDTGLELLAHTGDPELAARLAAAGVRIEADDAQAGGPARADGARRLPAPRPRPADPPRGVRGRGRGPARAAGVRGGGVAGHRAGRPDAPRRARRPGAVGRGGGRLGGDRVPVPGRLRPLAVGRRRAGGRRPADRRDRPAGRVGDRRCTGCPTPRGERGPPRPPRPRPAAGRRRPRGRRRGPATAPDGARPPRAAGPP